jgi:hypothetical protein
MSGVVGGMAVSVRGMRVATEVATSFAMAGLLEGMVVVVMAVSFPVRVVVVGAMAVVVVLWVFMAFSVWLRGQWQAAGRCVVRVEGPPPLGRAADVISRRELRDDRGYGADATLRGRAGRRGRGRS